MKFLGASQKIFFSRDQRRIWAVLEVEEKRGEEGTKEEEDDHRTHPMEEESPELASEELSRPDPTKELEHLQPLETGTE